MKRNILLIFILVILSLLLAVPVANVVIYKIIFNYYGDWIVPKGLADLVNGLPFTYLFLSTFIFGLFGKGKKWIWSVVSIIPIIYFLYYIESGMPIWIWSFVFFISGIILAKIVELITSKFKHPNPPMIVK